jgi:hypothetical protein
MSTDVAVVRMRELVVACWKTASGPFSRALKRLHAFVPVAVNTEIRLLLGLPSVKKIDARLLTTFSHCSPKTRLFPREIPNATALTEHVLLVSGGV